MLEHLAAHNAPPKLPPHGTLLVNSFLACRSFWLVLDDPAGMGRVDSDLDAQDRLRRLRFSQTQGRTPVKHVLLRVFGAVRRVDVTTDNQTFAPSAAAAHDDGRTDFRWRCRGPWAVTVVR